MAALTRPIRASNGNWYELSSVRVNRAVANVPYYFFILEGAEGCPAGFGPVEVLPLVSFDDLRGCVSRFEVVDNQNGHLEVFGKGTNGAIYHDWMTLPANDPGETGTGNPNGYNGGAWGGWQVLGPSPTFASGPRVSSVITYPAGDNISAYATDGSGNQWKNWHYFGNCCWNGWVEGL